ncbi:hypothetical protein [Rummeliibacillus pycnus]|uniref:hypothetical protein n=1 Tax=Rummeliibacillus pycnus TaxID=101070 RepID=UPI000C9D0512|nr:hypothetical protein [Rummeliibacillus pycnus]
MTEFTNKSPENLVTCSLQNRLTAELEKKIDAFEQEESQYRGDFRLIDTLDVFIFMAFVGLFFIITVI